MSSDSTEINNSRLTQMITCLQKTFTSADKTERETAEKELNTYEADLPSFTQFIFSVLLSSEIAKNIKISIALHLNRVISKHILSNSITDENKISIFKIYIANLISQNITPKIRENVSGGFVELLNSTESTPGIIVDLLSTVNNDIQNIQINSVSGFVDIISDIAISNAISKNNCEAVLKIICEICKKLMIGINTQISSNEISYQSNKEMFLYLNDTIGNIFHLFFICIFKLKKRIKCEDKEMFTAAFIGFVPIAVSMLNYCGINNIVISFTGEIAYDNSLNSMKAKIFKFINSTLSYLTSFENENNSVTVHSDLIKLIIGNLEWVVNNKLREILLNDDIFNKSQKKHNLLISYMLIYLSKIFDRQTFKCNLKEDLKIIFKKVALPFLIISEKEMAEAAGKDTEEYSALISDVVTSNKNKNIKSCAAGLMKTIYESFEQVSFYMISYGYMLLSQSVGLEISDKNVLNPDDDVLVKFLQQGTNPKEKAIDVSLLFLSILINETKNDCDWKYREKILDSFSACSQIILSKNIPVFISHKLCIFMKNFLEKIPDISKDAPTIFGFLFKNTLSNQTPDLIMKESSETLNTCLSILSKNDAEIVKKCILPLSSQITSACENITVLSFFDFLYDLITKFSVQEFEKNIFSVLAKRILDEANRRIERKKRIKFIVTKKSGNSIYDTNILINKCFNILRVLGEKKEFVINNIQTIENSLSPLIEFFKDLQSIDFDEDIVLIMTSIIHNYEKIPNIGFSLFVNLHNYSEKNKGMLLDLYELVDLYIVHSIKIIEGNQELLQALIRILKSSMDDSKFKKSPFYACTLFQIWCTNSSTIPGEIIEDFLKLSIDKIDAMFKIYDNDNFDKDMISKMEELRDGSYSYIGFITIIYSSFINYPNIVIKLMQISNTFSCLFAYLGPLFKFKLIPKYHLKALSLSLNFIIKNNYFLENSKDIIRMAFRLLFIQRTEESTELKKKLKNQIHCNFISEEEDEEENEDDNEVVNYGDEQELNDLVERTVCPLKDIDEFEDFRKTMSDFKQAHPDLYEAFVNSLSNIEKNEFLAISSMKRINVTATNGSVYSIPRKIVSIKRNKNA